MKKVNQMIFLFASVCIVFMFAVTDTQALPAFLEYTNGPGHFYNYAPSYIQVSSTEPYMYVCRNKEAGVVKDHFMSRKATKSGNNWIWAESQVALALSSNGGDERHVCDPEVIKGNFITKRNGTVRQPQSFR